MEREFNVEWRKKAEELWNFLEEHSSFIPEEFRVLLYECRNEAEIIKGDDNFSIWKERCEEKKIPFGIKVYGYWQPFPATENQYFSHMRSNARKGIKHGETSTKKAIEANVFVPTLETTISKIPSFLNFKSRTQGLIGLLKEDEEIDEEDEYEEKNR